MSYLKHHGIDGQKWGVKHGPPYPLDRSVSAKIKQRAKKKTQVDTEMLKTGERLYGAVSKEVSSKTVSEVKHEMDHNKSTTIKDILREAGGAVLVSAAGLYITDSVLVAAGAAGVYTVGRSAMAIGSKIKESSSEKRLANAEIDKDTGLHLKSKVWTAKQDVKAVNPSYRNFNSNTKNNCVLCSVAFDLRRRGYDVVAKKASYGYTVKDILTRWYPKAERGIVNAKRSISFKRLEDSMWDIKKGITDTRDTLLKQGEGARGLLNVRWADPDIKLLPGFNKGDLGGHSMVYEVNNGKVTVYDAQTGKTHSLNRILKNVSGVSYIRVDNVDFNKEMIKECVR